MTLDDEQLDDLLRRVEVPSSLKASLLTIPDRNIEVDGSSPPKSWAALLGTVATLAASVVLYFSIAPRFTPGNTDVAAVDEIAMLLAELQRNQESLDAILKMKEDVMNLQPDIEPVFDANESLALALSLSWQSAVDRGASLDSVRVELEDVIDRYPETEGARHAQGLLQVN